MLAHGFTFRLPKKILLEEGAHDLPMAKSILSRAPHIPVERFPEKGNPPSKRGLWILRRHLGRWVRPCPGTRGHICCGYWVINHALGCPFSCHYCIIPYYYGAKGITIFLNVEDALREIAASVSGPGEVMRFGTGEWTDSLALEPLLQVSAGYIRFFSQQKNAVLELKTKSTYIEGLLELEHSGRTVISWSINPQQLVDILEPSAPSLEERLGAAGACQRRGYPIGLHLDPIIWHKGWRENYRSLIEQIARNLDPEGIIWISLGALRYPPELHERLLHSRVATAELIPSPDGKRRYLRPLRVELFGEIRLMISRVLGDLFVYLCMESPSVWDEAMGWTPRDSNELAQRFHERITRYWSENRL